MAIPVKRILTFLFKTVLILNEEAQYRSLFGAKVLQLSQPRKQLLCRGTFIRTFFFIALLQNLLFFSKSSVEVIMRVRYGNASCGILSTLGTDIKNNNFIVNNTMSIYTDLKSQPKNT